MTYKEWIDYMNSLDYEESFLWFLLCEITNKSRSEINLNPFDHIKKDELQRLKEGTNRLVKDHYPPQYFLGYSYFYTRKFLVNEEVLIPRFDTEVIVETSLNNVEDNFTVLDLATGSGVIAISLKKENPSLKVTASDLSSAAIMLAKENAKLHQASIEFIESDLFTNIDKTFDLIVTNPPYIPKEEKLMDMVALYEPSLALFSNKDGLELSLEIIQKASQYLNAKGILIMEIHSLNYQSLVEEASKHFSKIEYIKDYRALIRGIILRR